MRAVLFDLDGTLVDTRAIEGLRKKRDWKGCVASVRKTDRFEGVDEVLKRLKERGIRIGIVTTSVSYYAEAVCRHHKLIHDTLVCYHDATPKPAPDSFLLALKRLELEKAEAIGVGDDLPDALALKEAEIRSYGAGWSPVLNPNAKWSAILSKPIDVLDLL